MKIDLRDPSKSFSSKQVLNSISLCIESGSFTTLLGPSRCRKTTLLRMVTNLETPDQGDIYFGGTCMFSSLSGINLPPERKRLGFVFQDFTPWPHMTVSEDVAFRLRVKGEVQGLDQQVKDALETVWLKRSEKRYPHQLSGERQQRVVFARVIAIRPPCILSDEPLSTLDVILREEMKTELKNLVSRLGTTSMFVTYGQIEAITMSDRIAVMDQENVEQYEESGRIYECPSTPFATRFVGKSNWISSNAMIRSERLSLTPTQRWEAREMEVGGVQYMGSAYEVILRSRERSWSLVTHKGMEPGQRLTVFMDLSHVLYFASEDRA